MKFTISNMWVDSFDMVRTDQKTDSGEEFSVKLDSGIEFNQKDRTQFRFALSINLHKSEKLIFRACQMAVLKFDREISEEDAKNELSTVDAASMLYPYLRAFTISTLRVAGYSNINLPMVTFK